MYAADGEALATLEAGPHYLVGIAADLMTACRRRFGQTEATPLPSTSRGPAAGRPAIGA